MRMIVTVCLLFIASAAHADAVDGVLSKTGTTYHLSTKGGGINAYTLVPSSPAVSAELNQLVGQFVKVKGFGPSANFIVQAVIGPPPKANQPRP